MSISELNKTKNLHNESANTIPITQENLYHAIDTELDKKETETPGSLPKAKSKDFACINSIENRLEHRADINEEVDPAVLANISNLKVHVTSPADARQKSTIKNFNDCIVDFVKQQRLQRQIRRPKRLPQLTFTTHNGMTNSQDLHQTYPPGPGYVHSQRYLQKEGQGKVTILRGGFYYDFNDRSPFILLVLAITCIMLATTAMLVGIVMLTPELRSFFRAYALIIFLLAIIHLISVQCIFVYAECSRRLPCNIICIIITVIAMSCLAAIMSSTCKTYVIFQAILATAIIMAICTILACTSFDFTSYLIYIIVFSLALTVVGLIFAGVSIWTGENMTLMHLILLLLCTLVQSVMFIVELQMLIGGKAIELDESEYALGAYYLYTSIVHIFMNVLGILGTISED